MTKITANTISEVTHYTTVSIGPKTNDQLIEEIKFVLLRYKNDDGSNPNRYRFSKGNNNKI